MTTTTDCHVGACASGRTSASIATVSWPMLVTTAALLAGCAGTPIPPWHSQPVGAPSGSAPSGSTTSPAILSAPALPYISAVAQRFPDPSHSYVTPGLQHHPLQFTSNEELGRLLLDLANQTLGQSPRLGLINIGQSQKGQAIHALMATGSSAISPDAIDNTGLPTIMVVAGQQGTNGASTEALLVIAQSLAKGGTLHSVLQKANILLVPRANPDGFDAQSASTANGTSLTTDHLTLQTPEARALAKLVLQYRPSVLLNAEEFTAIQPSLQQFGVLRANDVGLQYGLSGNVHEFVVNAQSKWLHRALTDQLPKAGQRVDWSYEVSSSDKILRMGTNDPTTLTNVSALKNIPSLSIHSRGSDLGLTHIQRRIHTHVSAISAAIHETVLRAQDLSKVQSFVTRDIASQACKGQITIQSAPVQSERTVVMLDPQSGADVNVRATWVSGQQLRTLQQRPRPCGYWLSSQSDRAVEKLRLLGVQVQRIAESMPATSEIYTTSANRTSTTRGTLEAEPNSYYISMNQPLSNVAAAALEPDMPYSFVRTGIISSTQHIGRIMSPAAYVFDED